jgi:hypothetical protein
MNLIPISNAFLFQFTDTVKDGMLANKNAGKILITEANVAEQGDFARWGLVKAIGPEVTQFSVGDYVLIGPGRWTTRFVWEEEELWKSDESEVLAVGTEQDTYQFNVAV